MPSRITLYMPALGGRFRSTQDMPAEQPAAPPQPEPKRDPHKVTARMLQLRELIAQGEYPDKDELAERIVDATDPVT